MSEAGNSNDQELVEVAGRHLDPDPATDPIGSPAGLPRSSQIPRASDSGVSRSGDGRTSGFRAGSSTFGAAASAAGVAGSASARGGFDLDGPDPVDLDEDPFDDDLTSKLKARVPLNLTSRTTLALSAAVLVVLGFLGGVLVQKRFGPSATATATGARAGVQAGAGFNGAPGANGAAGAGAGGTATGAGRGATTGTVKFVDGATIYLTTADGSTVTVKTNSTTAVRVLTTGAVKDIPVGSTVVVQGTADADGIITATQLNAQK